jgi:hypothetical protein
LAAVALILFSFGLIRFIALQKSWSERCGDGVEAPKSDPREEVTELAESIGAPPYLTWMVPEMSLP